MFLKDENPTAYMACPKCGNRQTFKIEAKGTVTIDQNKLVEVHDDLRWHVSHNCTCAECGFNATVGRFRLYGFKGGSREKRLTRVEYDMAKKEFPYLVTEGRIKAPPKPRIKTAKKGKGKKS